MNLFTSMFEFEPGARLTIADVLGHPWMKKEEIATKEEVEIVFTEQKEKFDQGKALAQIKKQEQLQDRQSKKGSDDKDNGPYLAEVDEEIAQYVPPLEAKLGLFDNTVKKQTQFFTNYQPELVITDILKTLQDVDNIGEINVDGANWKLTFNVVQKSIESEEVSDENTVIQVRLRRVPDQPKLCVDFSFKDGSKPFFYLCYAELIEKLTHLDTTQL